MAWLMSAIYDRFMRASEEACLGAWRKDLLQGLTGNVLEVGAGTGVNLLHYPSTVTRLVLAEPDADMARKLDTRLAGCPREGASTSVASVEDLPFESGSFDAVVATLLLCSVVAPARALFEIHRVLRPGGTFVFLEHVAAKPHTSRRVWQGRIEPLWKHVAGNCHLTRDTGTVIAKAGFLVDDLKEESMRRALPFLRPTIRGIATKPD
jgi:ubiquinone/menaquinone biosynthesis C-methylase UbiE